MRHAAFPICATVILAGGGAFADTPVYPTPEAAFEALVSALESGAEGAAAATMGDGALDLISSGDPAADAEAKQEFLTLWSEGHSFEEDDNGRTFAVLGADDWPFAVPVSRSGEGWSFDLEAGRSEMQLREVGGNEMDVIDLMRAYVMLQAEYRLSDFDEDGVMEFAAHILSSEGTRDGLLWDGDDSPVGDMVARASATGYVSDGVERDPEPYLGYYFHILTEQGANAPGGAMSYMAGDNMVAGHALLAFPAQYGVTGVSSFIVSENGQVMDADLGEDTLDVAGAIIAYDPDERWSPVAE